MRNNYTFHAYKPDSADICMGCLMASYSSDEIFEYELDEDELVAEWAKVLSATLDANERGYEDVHILCNGILLNSGDPDYDRLFAKAQDIANRVIEEREQAAKIAAEKNAQEEKSRKEAREREQYERLRAKFEKESS